MAQSVRDAQTFLVMLKYAGKKSAERRSILKRMKIEHAQAIAEIAVNSLYGILSLPPRKRKQLKKIKRFMKKMADEEVSMNKKKQIIYKMDKHSFILIDTVFPEIQKLIWHQN